MFFETFPKLIDFVNSNDCIGKSISKSIRPQQVFAKKNVVLRILYQNLSLTCSSERILYPMHYTKTYDIVYGIYRETYKKIVYVGETGNIAYQTHILNLSRIRTGRNIDTLTSHFRSTNHSTKVYTFFGIEKNSQDEKYRYRNNFL